MLRNIDLNEISDGNLYTANDLVRADCGGCHGCSDCCQGMGDSIILDPYDFYQLCQGLSLAPEALLDQAVGLSVVDGIILPHLNMTKGKDACSFLSEDGRCRIHGFRPGAVFFLSVGYMRTVLSPTSSRQRNVRSGTAPRSGSESGSKFRICRVTRTLFAAGIIFWLIYSPIMTAWKISPIKSRYPCMYCKPFS